MRLDIYVNYAGNCEEAFRFYETHLGGKVIALMRHGEVPNPNILKEWYGKIQHAQIEIGDSVLMGADVPSALPMRSAYVSLTIDDLADTERIYNVLSEQGEVFMKMEETFFARRFAMLRDRFGTSWMLLCEQPPPGTEP